MKNPNNHFLRFRTVVAVLFFAAVFGCWFCPTASAKNDDDDKAKVYRKFTIDEMSQIQQLAGGAGDGWRKGAGNYFSTAKLLLLTVLFWCWVATSSWTNNDSQYLVDLHRSTWNWLSVTVFPGAFLAALFIPIFWIGFPLALLAWLVPTFVYVHHRNTGLLQADKVMTADHLAFCAKRLLRMNVAPKKASYETGAPIMLVSSGADVPEQVRKGRSIAARNQPGFNRCRSLVYQAIDRQAAAIRLDRKPGETNTYFQIDGIWHPISEAFTSEESDQFSSALKVLCGCDAQEKRPQKGVFQANYGVKRKLDAETVFQQKAGAEEIFIQFQFKTLQYHSLSELGMNETRQTGVKKLLNADKGLVILSAMPGQGLRTMTNVAFDVADRFTRDFSTVEDIHKPYMPIENIQLYTYDSSKGESPMTVLPDVFFREAKVLLLREMVNADTFKLCCEEVGNDRLIITTFRGRDSADTIVRMLKTGIRPQLLADSLLFVLSQRLVRKLCPVCREEIQANPAIVRRLGLPPTTEKLWRKRGYTVSESGKNEHIPCTACQEIGYRGRTGLYDGIVINDEIRQILISNPTEEAIRRAALKAGAKGYLSDGARLVAEGVTDFEELARVLKN